MADLVKNTDGKLIRERPQFWSGREHYLPVHERAILEYQKAIYKRVEEWGLWEFFDIPGKMADEYRRRRKQDDDIQPLVQATQALVDSVENAEIIARNILNDLGYSPYYPLVGSIMKGHRIDADFLITQELGEIAMFALENTAIDPINDKACKDLTPEAKDEVRKSRSVYVEMHPSTGIGKLRMEPECAVPIRFCGDAHAPRSFPGTKLVPYDHTNWKHNAHLRGRKDYRDADAFLNPRKEVDDAKPEATAEVGSGNSGGNKKSH
jgi:hypothetical protein